MDEVNSHLMKMELAENVNVELAKNEFETELSIFKKGFEKCVEITIPIYEEAKPNEKRNSVLSTYMIMPRLFMSLKSILNLVLKGYYYDASILARSWMECLGLLIYLSKNEDEAQKWMRRKLNVSYINLMKEISDAWRDNKEKRFYPVYGHLSYYIHNLLPAIYTMLEKGETDEEGTEYMAPFTPSFNEKNVYESIVFFCHFYYGCH